MLKGDEILDFLRQHKQDLEARFSVRRIALFGSALSSSASEKSDVDILVELAIPTFDHYMDLKFFLEDQFGRPVDFVLADFSEATPQADHRPRGSLCLGTFAFIKFNFQTKGEQRKRQPKEH